MDKQKKLLIAGGSHADIPIIMAAKAMGFWVITSGNNRADKGHAYSDEQHFVDYSDKEALLAMAKGLGIDALVASANDFSALSCAYVAEALHLPGHDPFLIAQTVHHKNRFRVFALEHGLPVPKAVQVKKDVENTALGGLTFPVLVKPIDLTGGKGITKVAEPQMLPKAIANAFAVSRSDSVVVEEFIEGSNHGYSTFIKNGKVRFAFMDDEHYFVNPYLVSGASTSLRYSENMAQQLNTALEEMARELELCDGLLHVQFMLRDDSPIIIEICRRTPGDLYVKLVEYATGFNMSEAIVRSAAGMPVTDYEIKALKYITRHCVMSRRNGVIEGVSHGEFEPKIFDRLVFYRQGDRIENHMTYKAEIDFIRYEDRTDALRHAGLPERHINIVLAHE